MSFRPYVDRSPSWRRALGAKETRVFNDVDALKGVTFDVQRGEAFGVIGRNGAGKSTLMRLMARTMRPNEGTVTVNGRTSTLLQLGVGFNVQLSGRRNVYLGSLAAGVAMKDIGRRFGDIVAYAELGEAIERPMKTYSSGMFARLAFSVSMHMEPDILLLDEILAVGDAGFKKKSLQSMRDLLSRSGTIVLVSHSMRDVAGFCDRAVWLDEGVVRAQGPASEVVQAYGDFIGSETSK